jgi:hypothetical protein
VQDGLSNGKSEGRAGRQGGEGEDENTWRGQE